MTDAPAPPAKDPEGARQILIPLLQTVVLLSVVGCVTLLGVRHVVDAQAVTAILGAIAGSIGVLAGVGMATRRNGRNGGPQGRPPNG